MKILVRLHQAVSRTFNNLKIDNRGDTNCISPFFLSEKKVIQMGRLRLPLNFIQIDENTPGFQAELRKKI